MHIHTLFAQTRMYTCMHTLVYMYIYIYISDHKQTSAQTIEARNKQIKLFKHVFLYRKHDQESKQLWQTEGEGETAHRLPAVQGAIQHAKKTAYMMSGRPKACYRDVKIQRR